MAAGQGAGRGLSNAGCYMSNDNLLVHDSTIMVNNIAQNPTLIGNN